MPRLKELQAFLGQDFSNKEIIGGTPLKHKGLDIPNPKRYYGGVKIHQDFLLPYFDEPKVAVRINFEDVIDENTQKITKIKKDCVYYSDEDQGLGQDDNGFIWFKKTEYEIVRNEQKLKRSRYEASYDHLVKTGVEHESPEVRTVFAILLDFFNKEIQMWLLGNPQAFIDKLNAQDLPANILYLLNLPSLPGTSKNVRDGIIEQVSGIKWIE